MADAFEVHVNVLLDAIQVCCAKGLLVPALILLYAAMVGLAWLNLSDENEAVQRIDFETWADRYFVPEMRARGYREITADDLIASLKHAIGQIRREMVQNQSLANRILHRTAKHFANVTFQ